MLVTKEEVMQIVKDCKLVATKKSHIYNGKKLVDLQPYAGRYGSGYTVTQGQVTEYWVYPHNVVSKAVYNGEYSVSDACMTANNIHYVKFNGVQIVPSWQLELNTITGESTLKRTEESLKPIRLAGHTLIVMWHGNIENRILRLKIRRKLKELLRSGNAVFFENVAQKTE